MKSFAFQCDDQLINKIKLNEERRKVFQFNFVYQFMPQAVKSRKKNKNFISRLSASPNFGPKWFISCWRFICHAGQTIIIWWCGFNYSIWESTWDRSREENCNKWTMIEFVKSNLYQFSQQFPFAVVPSPIKSKLIQWNVRRCDWYQLTTRSRLNVRFICHSKNNALNFTELV